MPRHSHRTKVSLTPLQLPSDPHTSFLLDPVTNLVFLTPDEGLRQSYAVDQGLRQGQGFGLGAEVQRADAPGISAVAASGFGLGQELVRAEGGQGRGQRQEGGFGLGSELRNQGDQGTGAAASEGFGIGSELRAQDQQDPHSNRQQQQGGGGWGRAGSGGGGGGGRGGEVFVRAGEQQQRTQGQGQRRQGASPRGDPAEVWRGLQQYHGRQYPELVGKLQRPEMRLLPARPPNHLHQLFQVRPWALLLYLCGRTLV